MPSARIPTAKQSDSEGQATDAKSSPIKALRGDSRLGDMALADTPRLVTPLVEIDKSRHTLAPRRRRGILLRIGHAISLRGWQSPSRLVRSVGGSCPTSKPSASNRPSSRNYRVKLSALRRLRPRIRMPRPSSPSETRNWPRAARLPSSATATAASVGLLPPHAERGVGRIEGARQRHDRLIRVHHRDLVRRRRIRG